MDKSYVGLGVAICPVCGKEHDEVVLMDKRLLPTLKYKNFTEWKLCPDDQEKTDEFLALVEVSNVPVNGKTLKPSEANRTGNIAHIRRTAAEHAFSIPVSTLLMVFVDQGVIPKLQEMTSA